MSWLSISVEVDASQVEALSEAFLEEGALAVDVADAAAGSPQEQPLFAEGGAPDAAWRRSVVRALVTRPAHPGAVVAASCARAGMAPLDWSAETVDDQDWVRAS